MGIPQEFSGGNLNVCVQEFLKRLSQKRKLLVYGYVQGIEKEYKIQTIPTEICEITYLYQKFWDACHKMMRFDLVSNGKIAICGRLYLDQTHYIFSQMQFIIGH